MFTITFLLTLLSLVNPLISLACFKCMTNNFENDSCSDPFHSIDNHLEGDCQATSNGRHGLFPARFCVKISGVIVDVDRDVNRSLLRRHLYLRTCITDNIMDSSRSSDSTGNFHLKNFDQIKGVRMQGTITLCSNDGCNQNIRHRANRILIAFFLLLFFLIDLFDYWK